MKVKSWTTMVAGKLSVIFLLALLSSVNVFAQGALTANVHPSKIVPGEAAVISVKVQSSEKIEPQPVPQVPGLTISVLGISHSLEIVNGNVWKGYLVQYRVSAAAVGVYQIPALPIKIGNSIMQVEGPRLEVVAGQPRTRMSSRSPFDRLFEEDPFMPGQMPRPAEQKVEFEAIASQNQVVTGQPVVVRYYMIQPSDVKVPVQGITTLPSAEGVVRYQDEEKIPVEYLTGVPGKIRRHLMTLVFIPGQAGAMEIKGGAIVIAGAGFFGAMQEKELALPPVSIQVNALPTYDRPAGFGGSVGNFTLEAQPLELECPAHGEAAVTVRVSGKGNLYALEQPQVSGVPDGLRVIVSEAGIECKALDDGAGGHKNFRVSFIPDKPGDYRIEAVGLTVYDPLAGKYIKLNQGPFKLHVTPAVESETSGKDTGQGSLMWFVLMIVAGLVVLAVAVFIFGRELRRLQARKLVATTKNLRSESRGEVADHTAVQGLNELCRQALAAPDNGFPEGVSRYFAALSKQGPLDSDAKMWHERVQTARYGGRALDESEKAGLRQWLQKQQK